MLLEAHLNAWKQGEGGRFDPDTVLFICNKWDAVSTEQDEVKKYVFEELANRGFRKEQAFFISARDVSSKSRNTISIVFYFLIDNTFPGDGPVEGWVP